MGDGTEGVGRRFSQWIVRDLAPETQNSLASCFFRSRKKEKLKQAQGSCAELSRTPNSAQRESEPDG
jgi:hypothetical protein